MTAIVVTGASGLLGRALMRELASTDPLGTAYSRVAPGLTRLDLLDHAATTRFLEESRPAVIVHAAAERRPDVGEREPERTRQLNVEAIRHLARTATKIGAQILYLSTDYVFDGTHPPYHPDDATNPLNLYGETKLAGERALLAEAAEAAILRVGLLYGRVEYSAESSVTALVDDVRRGELVKVDHWGRRYPTFVDDLAVLCRQMIERSRSAGTMNGVWHWCGDEMVTKYDQACTIGTILGLSTGHLRPDPEPPSGAPRPHDCRLDCSALEALGLGQRTPFDEALKTSLRESRL